MSYVLTSLSGNLISAASAGYAPTNSADVSAIASAYATGGVDSATVSAIASAYVESGVSGKLDASAVRTEEWMMVPMVTSISGCQISAATAAAATMAESAFAWYDASSKQDASAMSAYALSSDVSGVIDTVSSNSASWGGGATGDYVEKSAMEVAIGSGNDVSATSFAFGVDSFANSVGVAFGRSNYASASSLAVGNGNSASSRSFALGSNSRAMTRSMAFGSNASATEGSLAFGSTCKASMDSYVFGSQPTATDYSFAFGNHSIATNTSVAEGYYVSAHSGAVAFGKYNLHGNGHTGSGDSAAFAIGDGTGTAARHDLMLVTKDGEITMYSSTADTTGTGILSSIRALSANAGGVDSATVSAIASSYAESAASGKLDTTAFNSGDFYTTSNPSGFITGVDLSDYATTAYVDSSVSGKQDASAMSDYQPTSAMTAYQLSGDYYSASNPSGFITGVDLSDYATTAYVDSSVSSKLDTTAYNSGDFYSTSNPSSFVDSAYVDSAVSDKADSSALSSYALSADVSGTVDLVSTQSANWGGSALQLSAGPGVKLEKVGDTLVAGLDETVLFSGGTTATKTAALSESITNFEWLKVRIDDDHHGGRWETVEASNPWGKWVSTYGYDAWETTQTKIGFRQLGFSASGTAISSITGIQRAVPNNSNTWESSTQTGQFGGVIKVIGINRTAGV